MCACHSIRDRSCWCSYSPRNGIWNCQNFWSPYRVARPTLICRPSWKRWVKLAKVFHSLCCCCKCRISHANWMTFAPTPYPLYPPTTHPTVCRRYAKACWRRPKRQALGYSLAAPTPVSCGFPRFNNTFLLLFLLFLPFHLSFMTGHYDFYGRPLKREKSVSSWNKFEANRGKTEREIIMKASRKLNK